MVVRVGDTSIVIEDCHSIPDRYMHVKKQDPPLPGKQAGIKRLIWGKRDLDIGKTSESVVANTANVSSIHYVNVSEESHRL